MDHELFESVILASKQACSQKTGSLTLRFQPHHRLPIPAPSRIFLASFPPPKKKSCSKSEVEGRHTREVDFLNALVQECLCLITETAGQTKGSILLSLPKPAQLLQSSC